MFDAYSTTSSNSSTRKEIDYDAMNQYVIETANLQQPETLVGVVVGIVDLGTQEQPDAELVFKGNEDDEAAEIEKNPNTYFKDGIDQQTKKPARLKCYPQKPQQSVAIAVDFPDIIVDKGQFYGNSNPQPLRMWLGGQFYIEGKGQVVARPTPLKVVNIDKEAKKPVWSFSPLHLFYKMAVAAKLVNPGQVFLPRDIDKLIGQAFQFQAQIFMKNVKGKEYFTENIKFVGGLGRGMSAPEVENTFLIQFNHDNKPEDLKQLRNHVINTIKAAQNFEGSKIQTQLGSTDREDDSGSEDDGDTDEEQAPVVQKPARTPAKSKKVMPALDEDDPDSPF